MRLDRVGAAHRAEGSSAGSVVAGMGREVFGSRIADHGIVVLRRPIALVFGRGA